MIPRLRMLRGGTPGTYTPPAAFIFDPLTSKISYDGNSLLTVQGTTGGQTVPVQAAGIAPLIGAAYGSVAIGGQTTRVMDGLDGGSSADVDALFDATKTTNILVVWEFTNSIYYSSGVDGAALAMKNYIANRLAAHPTWKIILLGTLPRYQTGNDNIAGLNASLLAINTRAASLYAEWGAAAFIDVRPPGGPFDLPDFSLATFERTQTLPLWATDDTAGTHVHLDNAGYAYIAGLIANAISTLGTVGYSSNPGLQGRTSNLQVSQYYLEPWSFSNLAHIAAGWDDGNGSYSAFENPSTNWLENITAGGSARLSVIPAGRDPHIGYFPPGDYQVSSASGVYCTVYGTGVTNVTQGTNASRTAYFTIADPGLNVANQADLTVQVFNGTGVTIASMNDLYIGLVSSKAAHDAGDIFDPRFIAQLKGTNFVRFNDWFGLNGDLCYSLDPAKLNVESNRSWADLYKQERQVPVSVAAKLCKRLNCGMWFGVPVGNDKASYSAVAATDVITVRVYINGALQTTFPHGYSNGDKVTFWGYSGTQAAGITGGVVYYARDVTATTLKISATLGGAPVDITADFAQDFGAQINGIQRDLDPYYDAVISTALAIFPKIKFVGEAGNESWNSLYGRNYFAGAGATRAGVSNAQDAYAWHQLRLWKRIEALASRAQNLRLSTMQLYYFNNFGPNLEYVDPGIISAGTKYKDIIDGHFTATYYSSGQTILQEFNAGAVTWTPTQWTANYKAASDTVAAQVVALKQVFVDLGYSTLKDKLYTYECGLSVGNNDGTLSDANYQALQQARRVFLAGPDAGAMGAYYIDAVFKQPGLKNANIWQAGNWVDNANAAWGMARASTLPVNSYTAAIAAWRG